MNATFVQNVEDILLLLVKQRHARNLLELAHFIADTFLEIIVQSDTLFNLHTGKSHFKKDMWGHDDDVFQRVLVRGNGARREGSSTLYVKEQSSILRNQVKICDTEDIVFFLKQRSIL